MVRIRVVGNTVVCCGNYPLGRIIDAGEFLKRNITLPVEILIPAGKGKKGASSGAYGDPACQAIADVALGIRINIVEGRGDLMREAI